MHIQAAQHTLHVCHKKCVHITRDAAATEGSVAFQTKVVVVGGGGGLLS